MTVEYINTILTAVKTVFISMLDMPVEFKNPTSKKMPHPSYEISNVIKISGDLEHWIIFSYPKETAKIVASEMLGETFLDISPELMDVLGEITNMVVGVADSELEIENVTYSLPASAKKRHQIEYPKNVFIYSMPCVVKSGEFEIDIALSNELLS